MIIEHGPVALGVAAEALGAGADGAIDGVDARARYEQELQRIEANRLQIESAELELVTAQEQRALQQQAADFSARHGQGALAAARFHDDGETGIPGVKRPPVQMPDELYQLWLRGDAETRAMIEQDHDIQVALATRQATEAHALEQANQLLEARGVYGLPEGAEGSVGYQQALTAAQEQAQEIQKELEDGILDPAQANEQLNALGQMVTAAKRKDQRDTAVHGAFATAIKNALGGDEGWDANPDLADYYDGWQKEFQAGRISTDEAMAIVKLQPNQLEAVLGMGARVAGQGAGRGATGQVSTTREDGNPAPAPAPTGPVDPLPPLELFSGEAAMEGTDRRRGIDQLLQLTAAGDYEGVERALALQGLSPDEEGRVADALANEVSRAQELGMGGPQASRVTRALGEAPAAAEEPEAKAAGGSRGERARGKELKKLSAKQLIELIPATWTLQQVSSWVRANREGKRAYQEAMRELGRKSIEGVPEEWLPKKKKQAQPPAPRATDWPIGND